MTLERTHSHTTTLYSVTSSTSTLVPATTRPVNPATADADAAAAISKSKSLGARFKSKLNGYDNATVVALVREGFDEREVRASLKAANGSEKGARVWLKHQRDHAPSRTYHADCTVCRASALGWGPERLNRYSFLAPPAMFNGNGMPAM